MGMNISLLLAVRERILAEPELYNQDSFCGTACCIAGHMKWAAVEMASIDQRPLLACRHPLALARELLGVPSNGLFSFASDWPLRCHPKSSTYALPTPEEGADAIIDFIITDGWTKPADWKALAEVSPELIPATTGKESLTCA